MLRDGYQVNHITKNPSLLTIQTGVPDNPETCSFMLDSIYATGKIPIYSLFTGTGDWNDTILWSHLPPLRHRNALINGNVTITTNTYCNNAAISSGNLQIAQNIRLSLNNLDLFETGASIHSEGEIIISDHVTFHKTFEEAGKWYFISFPFDVYPSGIDPRFEQKDATTGATIFMSSLTMVINDPRPTNQPETGKSCPSVPITSPCLKRTKVI